MSHCDDRRCSERIVPVRSESVSDVVVSEPTLKKSDMEG